MARLALTLRYCKPLAHTSQNIHLFSIYALTTPLRVCVCVSAHTCRPVCVCVCRRASGLHRGFCTSCVGHVEEDVSKGSGAGSWLGGRRESSGECVRVQILGAARARCSDRPGEHRRCQGGEKQRTKGSACASIKSDKHISTLATRKTPNTTTKPPTHLSRAAYRR